MYKLSTIFTCLLVALSASASPLSEKRDANFASDVWDPKITKPSFGTIWKVGTNQTIAWDTAGIPESALDTRGVIYLGHLQGDSEHLDIAHPLASGFTYRDGSVSVTVPSVDTRLDYIVALLGDSGNISPKFMIANFEFMDKITDALGITKGN
ncbi:unnamed protein product [Somion occarium]|uniref:Uncharacterized protein n=1 Tax=Somion occarium TaxID=3059160 RepID=A0ABP1CN64_9APHY